MFLIIFILCIPLAIPSLLLSFKLIQKNFLGTLFNKSIAGIFMLTGNIIGEYGLRPFATNFCYVPLRQRASFFAFQTPTSDVSQ